MQLISPSRLFASLSACFILGVALGGHLLAEGGEGGGNQGSKVRKWTDSTGKFSVDAELVGVEAGVARLKTADGTIIPVPVQKLSNSDRDYLQRTLRPKTPARGAKGRPVKRVKARSPEVLLATKKKLSAKSGKLADVAKAISETFSVPVFADERSLLEAGIRLTALVDPPKQAASLEETLEKITGEELAWVLIDGVLVITTPASVQDDFQQTRVYRITSTTPADQLAKRVTTEVAPNEWLDLGGPGEAMAVGRRILVISQGWSLLREVERKYEKQMRRVAAANLMRHKPLERTLQQPMGLTFVNEPLSSAAEKLSKLHKVSITIDEMALAATGIGKDAPISGDLSAAPLGTALDLALSQIELTWTANGTGLLITTSEADEKKMAASDYDVSRLGGGGAFDQLIELITTTVDSDSWSEVGGPGEITAAPPSRLRVTQTYATHRKLRRLFADLHAASSGRR